MPHAPGWYRRLANAISALESMPDGPVDRAGVEELLGVGKTEAWKLLRRWGAASAGGALVVSRSWLLAVLQRVEADPGYRSESTRHARLSDHLDELRGDLQARQIPIASPPRTPCAIGGLPDTILVGPGRIEIHCANAADALQQLLELTRAIAEDFGAFEEGIRPRDP